MNKDIWFAAYEAAMNEGYEADVACDMADDALLNALEEA